MIKKTITIDGQTNGIIAKMTSNGKDKYIMGNNNQPRLFTNLEVCKNVSKMIAGDKKLSYYIMLDEYTIIDINECTILYKHNTYQYFHNDILYIIKESRIYRTSSLGYICFEDGDTKRCYKAYGTKRQYELMRLIRTSLGGIQKTNNTIQEIKSLYKEYIVYIKGTTAKLHILYNSQLMTINQTNKSEDKRCLPFDKNMDKYVTFYSYIATDETESKSIKIEGENNANKVLNNLIQDLSNKFPELNIKYIPVDYDGFVKLED
jgi:hypothetical protein